MNIVLLSGGSGKRLWPLSNDIRSKQFLKVLRNEEGVYESMVQRVYRQIRSACKENKIEADITIATGRTQIDSIKSQLGESVDIVVEPERRDTFPAILLSAAYLYYKKKVSLDEAIIVLPVDPYADLGYFKLLAEMDAQVQKGVSDIVLMGINPTYPSAKYGYIIPDSRAKTIQQSEGGQPETPFYPGGGMEPKAENGEFIVKGFVEKPSEENSMELISQGALWNAGVFAFSLGYIVNIMEKYMQASSYEEMQKRYQELPKISFDYEIVEKSDSISIVQYDGVWKDLGTWNTLTEEIGGENIGAVMQGEGCSNTHIVNELDIPVVALGLKDVVVAASPDGILVSDKEKSSFIKPYVDGLEKRPMYEERRWGEYKVLDYTQYDDGSHALTKRLVLKAGKAISYQSHSIRDEIWTIVDGTGDFVLDGHIRNVHRGDVMYILKGQKHAIYATSNLQFIEVQIGEELSEDDKEEYEWDWSTG